MDAYVESFHSRNGFSRERMQPDEASAFDGAVRELVLSHRPDGLLEPKLKRACFGEPPRALTLSRARRAASR